MNGHKSTRRFLLFGTCVSLLLSCFFACSWINITKTAGVELRYDLEPVLRRYPELNNITSVVWCSDSFGNTTFGKNTYWLEGYIQLGSQPENADTIQDWQAVKDIDAHFSPEKIDAKNIQWYHSEVFDEYYRGTIMFISRFYYSPDELLLYVYAETS